MTESTEIAERPTGAVATRSAIDTYLTTILDKLPDPGEDDGTGILAAILQATTLEELDKPWSTAGMAQFRDHVIRIEGLKKMPSDFAGGLPFYLLAEGCAVETGEYAVFPTSSAACMAQLLVAFEHKLLPWDCYVRIAQKPTKNGFYPMHLETYRGGALHDPKGESIASAVPHTARVAAGAAALRATRLRGAAGPAAGHDPHEAGSEGGR